MRRLLAALAIIAGLGLGAGAGALQGLRLPHLARLGLVPAWMGAAAPEGGALAGAVATEAGLRIRWQLAGIAPSGSVWRIGLEGPGTRLEGEARLAGGGVEITGLAGEAMVAGGVLAAAFDVREGWGRLDAAGFGLSLTGESRGARFEGSELPPGRARFGHQAGGRWLIELGEAPGQRLLAGDELRFLLTDQLPR